MIVLFFFFNDTATTEIYTLSLHDALPILGSQYVLGLKAVNCQSGDLLAQEQVTAAAKEKVLDALGYAVTKLRGKLGESLATRSEEHTSELQSESNLVCRLLLEKKKI